MSGGLLDSFFVLEVFTTQSCPNVEGEYLRESIGKRKCIRSASKSKGTPYMCYTIWTNRVCIAMELY